MGAVGRRLDTELFQPPFLKGIHEHLCIGVLSLARHYNRERVKICVKLTQIRMIHILNCLKGPNYRMLQRGIGHYVFGAPGGRGYHQFILFLWVYIENIMVKGNIRTV